MALVRCSCIGTLRPGTLGESWRVTVADPDCHYVPHRLEEPALLPERDA